MRTCVLRRAQVLDPSPLRAVPHPRRVDPRPQLVGARVPPRLGEASPPARRCLGREFAVDVELVVPPLARALLEPDGAVVAAHAAVDDEVGWRGGVRGVQGRNEPQGRRVLDREEGRGEVDRARCRAGSLVRRCD